MNVARADFDTLRVPPSSIDAEQAVLGMLMVSPQSIAKISDWLVAEDFYRQDHRLIYKAVCGLIERGSPCDAVTMIDWLETNGLMDRLPSRGYLMEMYDNTASSANIVAYAEIVVEKSRLRSIIDVGTTMSARAWGNAADSQAILGDTAHDLATMQASKLRGGLESIKAGMVRFHQELKERYAGGSKLLGLPWPWEELNKRTKGMRDGVLYVIGARPSMGKSVFALQTAVNAALNGSRTAFFSVEMTAEECVGRAVSSLGRIPHDWVENPSNDAEDADLHWIHLEDATGRILAAPLLIDETPGITIDQLVARAKRAHMQSPLRLIVVDHMHDMQLDHKRETRHEYGRIAQAAKSLAKELKCPVLLLAQLNRSIAQRADKHPTLTDLRESGEIEQKADVVLFLHREDYYDKETHLKGMVEIITAKGRNIRVGENIPLQNAFDQMRLDDWIGSWPAAPQREQMKSTKGFK